MSHFTLLPGDGIGPEVISQANFGEDDRGALDGGIYGGKKGGR